MKLLVSQSFIVICTLSHVTKATSKIQKVVYVA